MFGVPICTASDVQYCCLMHGAYVVASWAEFFLFHGLNGGLYADKITRFGMDPRYSSVEGMFGAGLYFADLASKSNQYVHCGKCELSGAMPRDPVARGKFVKKCKCKQNDVACALLCRVTLGDTLIEKNYRGNGPGQFWHARRREPEKPKGGGIYNSVVGESRAKGGSSLEFRECELPWCYSRMASLARPLVYPQPSVVVVHACARCGMTACTLTSRSVRFVAGAADIVYESKQVYPEYKVYFRRVI